MKKNDWKKREGIVFSTDSNYEFNYSAEKKNETLQPAKQFLRVKLDKSGRAGKVVTLISGFVGTETDIENLTRLLKTRCGVGGSSKEGEIIIQGDLVEKVKNLLLKEGYKCR